ncbi:MAG: hypothetical protein K2H26_05745, partial [Ruminococcus sp.]|nr:hypothetical protein [Ruminococcus sp.]
IYDTCCTDVNTVTTTTSETTGTGETTESTTTDVTTGTGETTESTTTSETTGTGETTESTTTSVTTGTGAVLNEVKSWSVAVDPSGFGTGSGFYYSHETSFRKEQVKGITLHVEYVDSTLEPSDIDISESFDFASTPAETFIYGDADFKYVATLVYRGGDIIDDHDNVILKDGDVLKTKTGEDAGVEVYIGIMGDVDLDYLVNAVDATQILMYYASLSTGKGQNETLLSKTNPKLVTDPLCIYDQFAAFLGDVNQVNLHVEENWKTGKVGRLIDATDSTSILSYYAAVSTGKPHGIETWNSILGK